MYIPPAFRETDVAAIHDTIRAGPLASFVTATAAGLLCTPLPLLLDPHEGDHGVLYGHLARANPQWREPMEGEALAIFSGADAYVTPSWYATKRETGKVVPTWNYVAVHTDGPAEFFDDAERLLAVVTRLTEQHEGARSSPWAVADALSEFVSGQLRGIVGLRLPITRLEGKRKMNQNRSAADRAGVTAGLAAGDAAERRVAALIPTVG